MILFELFNTEAHEVYQELAIANVSRQYDFLRSIVIASSQLQKPFFSTPVLKALNFHAIACLHVSAGEFRPCAVKVGPDYLPPDHYRVPSLMEEFINQVNLSFSSADAVVLAAFVLWRLNNIHPFINGNGRTARAACYYILCAKSGGWLEGAPILPALLDREHDAYVAALKHADRSIAAGPLDLAPLHELISTLLKEQLGAAAAASEENVAPQADGRPDVGPGPGETMVGD